MFDQKVSFLESYCYIALNSHGFSTTNNSSRYGTVDPSMHALFTDSVAKLQSAVVASKVVVAYLDTRAVE